MRCDWRRGLRRESHARASLPGRDGVTSEGSEKALAARPAPQPMGCASAWTGRGKEKQNTEFRSQETEERKSLTRPPPYSSGFWLLTLILLFLLFLYSVFCLVPLHQGKPMEHLKNFRVCASVIFFILILICAQLPTFTRTIDDPESGLLEKEALQKLIRLRQHPTQSKSSPTISLSQWQRPATPDRVVQSDAEVGRAALIGLQEVDRNRKRTGNVNTRA